MLSAGAIGAAAISQRRPSRYVNSADTTFIERLLDDVLALQVGQRRPDGVEQAAVAVEHRDALHVEHRAHP